jgi:parallel beta-helix repeat protein
LTSGMFAMSGKRYTIFDFINLEWKADGAWWSHAANALWIYQIDSSDFTVHSWFFNGMDWGISSLSSNGGVTSSNYGTVDSCEFSGNGSQGVYLVYSKNFLITNSSFHHSPWWGILQHFGVCRKVLSEFRQQSDHRQCIQWQQHQYLFLNLCIVQKYNT